MSTNWKFGYEEEGWANKPSLFAETITPYLPQSGTLLELGAGLGQDSRYFAERGLHVTSTDISPDALGKNIERTSKELRERIRFEPVDVTLGIPFHDESFDVIYAHLSLHYFDDRTLHRIMSNIRLCLKENGVFGCLLNSTDDPEYGTGESLGSDLFLIDGYKKRFFSVNSFRPFVEQFNSEIFDNKGETYKDAQKGVHNLIRFIGRKQIFID